MRAVCSSLEFIPSEMFLRTFFEATGSQTKEKYLGFFRDLKMKIYDTPQFDRHFGHYVVLHFDFGVSVVPLCSGWYILMNENRVYWAWTLETSKATTHTPSSEKCGDKEH